MKHDPHHTKTHHGMHGGHSDASEGTSGVGTGWPRAEKVGAKPAAGRPRYLEHSTGDVDGIMTERPHYHSDTPDFHDSLFSHKRDAPGV